MGKNRTYIVSRFWNNWPTIFKSSWFVISDLQISIRFVSLVFQGSLLCDHPVSGNNPPVKFASQFFLIFLILATCKNKATFACLLWQKSDSPSRFPSLFLSSLQSFSAKLGEHYIVICINPAFFKMIDEQKNPKSRRSLQYAQRDTTNFAVTTFFKNKAYIKYSWCSRWEAYL